MINFKKVELKCPKFKGMDPNLKFGLRCSLQIAGNRVCFIIILFYVTLLVLLLLWPFDFALNHVRWLKTQNGLEFFGNGQVISRSPVKELYNQLSNGTGISLELWIASNNLDQSGPARIVSYSQNPRLRNFTIAQAGKNLVFRLRTTATDLNGMNPSLEIKNVFTSKNLQHIVTTYNFEEQNIHLNGKIIFTGKILKGNFDNWDPDYPFVLGNEASGDRPWRGKIYRLSIYNRPLRPDDVLTLFKARTNPISGMNSSFVFDDKSLVVSYQFSERNGRIIENHAGLSTHLDLKIPIAIHTRGRGYMSFSSITDLQNWKSMLDFLLNIALFIPLGFLAYHFIRIWYGSMVASSLIVISLSAILSFSVESLQYFLPSRDSSILDMTSNTLGASLGIVADRFLKKGN